jgi:hypothetical protein
VGAGIRRLGSWMGQGRGGEVEGWEVGMVGVATTVTREVQ